MVGLDGAATGAEAETPAGRKCNAFIQRNYQLVEILSNII
jgi:hypothetical protein